jgi:hypothetical protein
MGFIKNQQVKAAIRLLAWQYEKHGQSLPETAILERHARQLVDDAHRIARERGGNMMSILKEMVAGRCAGDSLFLIINDLCMPIQVDPDRRLL